MKLNAPRIMLMAGLALALNLDGAMQAFGAGAPVKKKTITLVKTQTGAYSPSPPADPYGGTPAVSPVPLAPTPDPYPGSAVPNSQTLPPDPSPVTTVPMRQGTQPALAPMNRPPMGLFYGEQERLDSINNPSPRQLPSSNSSSSVPVNQYPQSAPNYPAAPVEPMLPNQGTPGIVSDSNIIPSPAGTVPQYGVPDRFGYAPPPGTLGQTYLRRSRPIEDNKHPRVGAVEVNLPEWVDVTSKGLKPKWTGKLWRLESDSLIPGVPHIYEIKASWGDGTQPQVRTVRLIMGRIVDLDF